jgi:hypothetical protein
VYLICLVLSFGVLIKIKKLLVLAGAAAICWPFDVVVMILFFYHKVVPFPSQVIYSAIHWLRKWTILQKHGARDMVLPTYRCLKQVLRECFFQSHGWRSSLEVGRWCSGKLY